MSFSSVVKEELSRFEEHSSCCRRTELTAVLRAGLTIRSVAGVRKLLFISENAALARHIFSSVKLFHNHGPEVLFQKTHRFREHAVYQLDFSDMMDGATSDNFLADCGITIAENGIEYKPWKPKTRCCRKAFLRGFYLATGSISDPDRSYHLEVSFQQRVMLEAFIGVLGEFGVEAKEIKRKGHLLAYLKEGQEIVDFLNITGAHTSLMKLENIRIMKEMRNQVNRLVNCETANLEKTVNASVRQIDGIRYLQSHLGLDALPDSLRETARIRLEHVEISLQEIGEMLNPVLTKSGVNHRLRKLEKMAETLKEKLEENHSKG